ncbi:hypothetical protein DSO57_1027123 [Entomophthora muscae]|uniref:Uncharacterized protein n=1 Tax=Entomophthora muscae TaxID=34485 RepID=A0ACC2ULP1_9FUNG|nr:hypothetical protein DSO57_1027123 [Entomophthora muscae]
MKESLSYLTRVIFHSVPGTKVPGLKKACDHCHDRKVRCVIKDNSPCQHCEMYGFTCEFTYHSKPRGRKKRSRSNFSGIKVDLNISPLFNPCPAVETYIPGESAFSPPKDSQPFLMVQDYSLPHFRDLEKYSLSLR